MLASCNLVQFHLDLQLGGRIDVGLITESFGLRTRLQRDRLRRNLIKLYATLLRVWTEQVLLTKYCSVV